jgi:hypothetical protein
LSFFDEAEEPRTEPRTAPRRRRPSGSGRRPPSDQQAVQRRRIVAVIGILIVVVLIVLGVHSCQVSARNSAMKDYSNNVSSLIQRSDQTGAQFFGALSSGGGSGGRTGLQTQIDETLASARLQLTNAENLDVPDEMKPAQQNLLLTMQMRRDGIASIASQIQPALGTSTNKDAINRIAADMARFYASDVVYKDYTTPLISGALKAVGITGQPINLGQFLPDIQWLNPSYVAKQLHVSLTSSSNGNVAPGTHGHSLDSVSVGGTTLQTGSTNTIPASPAPPFTFHITNGGTNNETNVVLKVTVSGTSVSGQSTLSQTTAGQSTTGQVTLSSSPTPGSYTVTATVEPVPGEKNTANNTQSFPVTFQ